MAEPLPSLMLPRSSWIRASSHRKWLHEQGVRLLDFSKPSRMEKGFVALDNRGHPTPGSDVDTILTARMTHVYAVAGNRGFPGCLPLARHGVTSLLGPLRDAEYGGWFTAPGKSNDGRKQAYLHAFISLAASSAVVARVEGAQQLLDEALSVWERRFWSEEEGVFRESFARDWSDEENYRGANANMHSVEACMAVADVTGNPVWRQRALRITERFMHTYAKAMDYAVPEHFDRNWILLRDFNKDKPTDDLRPYGMTPGHFLEWSHLLLKLEAAFLRNEGEAPSWLFEDSVGLFEMGMRAGWERDGAPGVLYTVDFSLNPVVHVRPHWCQAEALTAAAALLKRTGNVRYEKWYRTLWDYVDMYMIDRELGGWRQELDQNNRSSEVVYAGKADLYHAWQSTLAPLLPLAPGFATASAALDS
ncbi:AGE family epimerase/isomerase [Acetobacter fallax]|uniref:Sugar isomerase n=1 Tax=Acetobacter fallax TaxID=1737473 RepID=A0ABX0KBF2_9PROT|nr:AGE family epimerase/isomerase [Acetobacter fallax]NHO32526.1 sugar isomerase [Acetobacter fallax]NHO36130.1 sugar isomerase [Acetobacter fallax]